jgi:hypothetical protein
MALLRLSYWAPEASSGNFPPGLLMSIRLCRLAKVSEAEIAQILQISPEIIETLRTEDDDGHVQ